MIARVVYGKLLEDADADQRRAAWEQAIKAHEGLKGCRAIYCCEPPTGEEGVLTISLWDSQADAVAAYSAQAMSRGLAGFSNLLAEPPRGKHYPVVAASGES